MKWEHQVVAKSDLAEFIVALNHVGDEVWEAVSGAYSIGVPQRISVGGATTVDRPGAPQWVAVMKRVKTD
jgi:hypothetical protein